MTDPTVNEAADRLRDALYPIGAPIESRMLSDLTTALATERRLERERIEALIPAMVKAALPGAFLRADDLALGSEAARSILKENEGGS